MKKLPRPKGGKHQSFQPMNWNWKALKLPINTKQGGASKPLQFKKNVSQIWIISPNLKVNFKKKRRFEMAKWSKKTTRPIYLSGSFPQWQNSWENQGPTKLRLGNPILQVPIFCGLKNISSRFVVSKYLLMVQKSGKKNSWGWYVGIPWFYRIFDTSKPVVGFMISEASTSYGHLSPQKNLGFQTPSPRFMQGLKPLERIVFNRKNWDIQQNIPIENLFCSINVHGQCIQPPCSIAMLRVCVDFPETITSWKRVFCFRDQIENWQA